MNKFSLTILGLCAVCAMSSCGKSSSLAEGETTEERVARSKSGGNEAKVLTAEERETNEQAVLAFHTAVNRMGGREKYEGLLPEFNRLQLAFFNERTEDAKRALLDYTVTNNLFIPIPEPVSKEELVAATKTTKRIVLKTRILTSSEHIEEYLNSLMPKPTMGLPE